MSSIRDIASLLRRRWRERAHWRRWGADFARFFGRRFLDDQCLLWAGMLCYASLLALVPLMVVAFGVISAFPVFDQWSESLRNFIFDNFVPATGDIVQRHVDRFVAKATELSALGVLTLILSSILLMVNVERALNRIWRASSPRSPGSRFVVYWSVLTVGPLLLGASLAISSYVASLPLVEEAAATLGVRGLLLGIAPFAASALAFTLIFIIVPNVSVRWRYAAGGGLLAAILFEAAKGGAGPLRHQLPGLRDHLRRLRRHPDLPDLGLPVVGRPPDRCLLRCRARQLSLLERPHALAAEAGAGAPLPPAPPPLGRPEGRSQPDAPGAPGAGAAGRPRPDREAARNRRSAKSRHRRRGRLLAPRPGSRRRHPRRALEPAPALPAGRRQGGKSRGRGPRERGTRGRRRRSGGTRGGGKGARRSPRPAADRALPERRARRSEAVGT